MQYKEVGDFCLDMLGIQILLTERNVFKNKTWGEKSLKNYSDDQNNWEGCHMKHVKKVGLDLHDQNIQFITKNYVM